MVDGLRTTVNGYIVENTKIDWNTMMIIMSKKFGCEVEKNSNGTTLLFGGDYRKEVKELLLKYRLYEEGQIKIYPTEYTISEPSTSSEKSDNEVDDGIDVTDGGNDKTTIIDSGLVRKCGMP